MAAKSKKSGRNLRPAAPARTLTTRQVADALSVKVRIVQQWARAGCPRGAEAHPRGGRPQLRFALAEVRTWLQAQGLDPRHPMGEALVAIDPAPAGEGGAAGAGPAPEPADEIARLAQRIDTLADHVTAFMGQRPAPHAGIGAAQQWSGAIKNLSHELRQLEAHMLSATRRRREWIRRAEALASLVGLAEVAALALDALQVQAGDRLAQLAEQYLEGDDAAAAGRDAAAAVAEHVEDLKAAIGRHVERVSSQEGA